MRDAKSRNVDAGQINFSCHCQPLPSQRTRREIRSTGAINREADAERGQQCERRQLDADDFRATMAKMAAGCRRLGSIVGDQIFSGVKTGLNEAILTGRARLEGIDVRLAVCDFSFFGASMGSVMGEKVRVGIQAPRDIPVFRKEVYLEIQQERAGGARDEVDQALQQLGE